MSGQPCFLFPVILKQKKIIKIFLRFSTSIISRLYVSIFLHNFLNIAAIRTCKSCAGLFSCECPEHINAIQMAVQAYTVSPQPKMLH